MKNALAIFIKLSYNDEERLEKFLVFCGGNYGQKNVKVHRPYAHFGFRHTGSAFLGDDFSQELYSIWYEHAQRDAATAFEYLDENFTNQDDIIRAIDKLLK